MDANIFLIFFGASMSVLLLVIGARTCMNIKCCKDFWMDERNQVSRLAGESRGGSQGGTTGAVIINMTETVLPGAVAVHSTEQYMKKDNPPSYNSCVPYMWLQSRLGVPEQTESVREDWECKSRLGGGRGVRGRANQIRMFTAAGDSHFYHVNKPWCSYPIFEHCDISSNIATTKKDFMHGYYCIKFVPWIVSVPLYYNKWAT